MLRRLLFALCERLSQRPTRKSVRLQQREVQRNKPRRLALAAALWFAARSSPFGQIRSDPHRSDSLCAVALLRN